MSLATNRSILPSSSRSAATTPRPRPSRSTMPASVVTSTNRPPSLRKTWSGSAGKQARVAVAVLVRAHPRAAEQRVDCVPFQVVADIEVQVAVVVEVGPGRRRRPVAVAAQPRARRDVLEPAVAAGCGKGHRTAIG